MSGLSSKCTQLETVILSQDYACLWTCTWAAVDPTPPSNSACSLPGMSIQSIAITSDKKINTTQIKWTLVHLWTQTV